MTTQQLVDALAGQPLTLATAVVNTVPAPTPGATGPGSDAPGSAAGCEWVGAPIAPQAPYYFDRTVTVNVSVVPYPTSTEARMAFGIEQQQDRKLAGAATIPPVSGVGDAAYLGVPGPQDGTAVLDVLTGRFTFSVSVTAVAAVFVHAPWVPVAAAIVANLAPSAPAVTGGNADYSVCGKGLDSAAEAAGAQAGGDYVRGYHNGAAYLSNDGLYELWKHNPPSDVGRLDYRAYDVGFFDAITGGDIQYLVTDLGKFHDTVTLTRPPENLQPLDPLYADGSTDPWFWHAFEAALASCRISYQFASAFVGYHDGRPDYLIYKYLAADAAACRGLMVALPHQEIFDDQSADDILTYVTENGALAADDSYREVAAEALSTDIASLLEASAQPVHFTFPQAMALDNTAAQRSGVPSAIQEAVEAYATSTLPPAPPSPASFDYYVPWLTTIESLTYLVAAPDGVAAATATANLDAGLKFLYGLLGSIPGVGPFETIALDVLNGDPHSAPWDGARGVLEDSASDTLGLGPFGLVVGLIDDALTSGESLDAPKPLAANAQVLCNAENNLKFFVEKTLDPRADFRPPTFTQAQFGNLYLEGAYLIADANQLGDLYNALDFVAYLLQRQVKGTSDSSRYQAHVALSHILYATCDDAFTHIAVDRPFNPYGVVASEQLSVTANQTLQVSGTGFAAGSEVTVTGHSRDVRLAVVRADATGAFATIVRPGRLGLGEHQVTASGTSPLGVPHQIVWRLRVSVGHRSMPPHLATWWIVAAGGLLLAAAGVIARKRRRRVASTTSPLPGRDET